MLNLEAVIPHPASPAISSVTISLQGKPQPGKPVAMYIDARPAADDLSGVWDRVRLPFLKLWRAGREDD